MSVVEEESNADDDNEEGIMYTLSHFEGILQKWWSTADQGRGNVTLSADKLSQTLLLDDVFKEQETTRRNFILQIHQCKTSDPLTTYPEIGEDILIREDYMQIFAKGIIRELLT